MSTRPGYLREQNGRYYGQVSVIHPVTGKRKQAERALGLKRREGSKDGLTRKQAFELLNALPAKVIEELTPKVIAPSYTETIADLHPLVLAEVAARGRKKSTRGDYAGYLKHYRAFADWETKPVSTFTKRDVEAFRDNQLAPARLFDDFHESHFIRSP